jgi:hypothetical protein
LLLLLYAAAAQVHGLAPSLSLTLLLLLHESVVC